MPIPCLIGCTPFCNVNICDGTLVLPQISVANDTYTLVYFAANHSLTKTVTVGAGDAIYIPLDGLNEHSYYQVSITNSAGLNIGCVSFTTISVFNL